MSKHNNFSASRPSKSYNTINNNTGGDMGLSLTGMRIGPLDPSTHKPKVGTRIEVVRPEHSAHTYKPEILKVTSNHS